MGRYLLLTFYFEGVANPVRILEPLFSDQLFAPIAVGGIAPPKKHKRGVHWFLAGYGLEYFVNSIHRKPVFQPGTITMIAEGESEEHDYLLTISNHIRQGTDLEDSLSPFELYDARSGVTYLDSGHRIGNDVLEEMFRWLDIHPRGEFYLYGAIDISMPRGYRRVWKQAFRFSNGTESGVPSSPTPLLKLVIERSAIQPDRATVAISTDATIWLQEAQALNGLIGPHEAEENLAKFATLVQIIFDSTDVRPTIDLHLEGTAFYDEGDRIRRVISRKLNYLLRP